MKGKTIVLADSSYTIRRIVELSFSEIEDVEIVSFESGANIKEKLLELTPAVVIVDVKLPVVNGYEVCQFVNQTESLNRTRIFLMKGSFEPINQDLIQKIKFEEIITKPFDSNMLVSAVMKILEEQSSPTQSESPESLPEEFSSIETDATSGDELSFSDIREELMDIEEEKRQSPRKSLDDEIQPSEEITQQQVEKDNLESKEEDSYPNPFESDTVSADQKREIPMEYPAEQPVSPEIGQNDFPVGSLDTIDQEEKIAEEPISFPIENQEEEFQSIYSEEILNMGESNEETSEAQAKGLLEHSLPEIAEEHFPGEFMGQSPMNIEFPEEPPPGSPAIENEPKGEVFQATDSGSISHIFSSGEKESPGEPELEVEGNYFPAEETDNPKSPFKEADISSFSPPTPVPPPPPLTPEASQGVPISMSREEIVSYLDSTFSKTIRDVLWELLPKLAEKIIREEIEKIKLEADKNQ